MLSTAENQSEDIPLLPSPLLSVLRSEAQGDVQELSQISERRSLVAILMNWLFIMGFGALFLKINIWWLYPIIAFLIGTRQHALLILMHDASHNRLFRNRSVNDFVSDFFLAHPFLVETKGYRAHHFRHHKYLNSDHDPDWVRKANDPNWEFPKEKWDILKSFVKYLYGYGILEWIRLSRYFSNLANHPSTGSSRRPGESKPKLNWILKWISLGTLGLLMSLQLGVSGVLLFWVIPLVFCMLPLQHLRSVTEHFGLARSHPLNQARDTTAGPIETFLFAPHGTNYHLVHHLFPSVPFFNLGRLHDRLSKLPTYRAWAHQNTSYVLPSEKSVWTDLVSSPKSKPF